MVEELIIKFRIREVLYTIIKITCLGYWNIEMINDETFKIY